MNGCGKWVIKPCPEITDNMASYEKWLIIVFFWGGGYKRKKYVTCQILEGSVFQLMLRCWGNIFFPLCKKTESKCNFTVCHISYLLGLAYLKQMINFKQHWFDTLYFWFILNEQIRFLNWEREEETQPLNIMKGNICLSYKSWQQTKHILNCGNCSK